MSQPFDLWDQAVLTDLVVRPITSQYEDQPRLGDAIAPITPIQSRVAKIRTYETKAFGVGQFKAPDATPALYKPDQVWGERIVELVLLEEMERIGGEDWIKLNSSDETVARSAGVDLIDRGKILQTRNERLTEKLRWDALLNGVVNITYPSGQKQTLDYGYLPTHKVTAGTLWSDTANADPIANIRAWSNVLGADSGYYGLHLHMSSETYDYLVNNAKVRSYLTATDRSMLIPTEADIQTLLRDGTDITIYDNGYRDESVVTAPNSLSSRGIPNSLTRFLPPGYVLLTTDYSIDGTPIADTLDGQVLVAEQWNKISIKQGPQAEVILDPMSKNHFLRVASARVPRIIYPEAVLVAKVA